MRNRVPPPLLTVVSILLIWFASRVLPALNFTFGAAIWVGSTLVICGIALLLWAGVLFKRKKTTVNPFRPKSTKTIVATGPYRFSRNPMYLGMMLTIIGVGLYIGSLSLLPVCIIFMVYINETQIKPEERALAEAFGAEFKDYISNVRRWV